MDEMPARAAPEAVSKGERGWQRRELARIKSLPTAAEQADGLSAIAADIKSQTFLQDAIRQAEKIGDPDARRRALAALAPALAATIDTSGTRKLASLLTQIATGTWGERLMVILSLLLAVVAFGGLAYVCWYSWMTGVWSWGFDAFSWRSFVAPIVVLYLAIIPFAGIMVFPAIAQFWTEYGSLRQQISSARNAQRRIEEKLQENDPHDLVLVLSYSREMLGEYYAIAMNQAQRSFRYCLIAMWLGFTVLILGVLDSFVPLGALATAQLGGTPFAPGNATPVDANELVLITGAVIEFIAAAFLWVYRFSIKQQTYYYRRQLRLHNALLAYRLTADMGDARNAAIGKIVERLLEDMETSDLAPPDATGFRKLIGKK